MAQDTGKILPLFINVDTAYDKTKPEESPFIKGLSWDINANPEQGIGTNNPSGEGQNEFILTPTRSNAAVPNVLLPETGWNKNVGSYESPTTKEVYFFTYNSLSRHCIHVLSGDTGICQKVVEDPKLAFTDNQEGFIANERVSLRYVKDKDGNITEKHLVWTNGKKWQGWVNVIAAIATNGFDASLFPYWSLTPPHFDREELLEWPVRPCMIKPQVQVVANTADDLGKINRIVDKAFRFAVVREYTDRRTTTLSPYSLPLTVKSEEFLNNPDNLPKNAKIILDAGSPTTEKLLIYVQRAASKNTLDSISVWGDWVLYDTIEKFSEQPNGAYWLRTNAWANYNYNPVLNTIEYPFDNSKVGTIVSQADANLLQSGMPQISQALTDVDDAVLLCNNRYKYNNFSKFLLDKLSATVKQREVNACARPLRTIYLYAYVGECYPDFSYSSQVGYTLGDDTKVRFGGLRMAPTGVQALIDTDEAKSFGLDFADKKAFRVYLKGTPYFADGEWYIVRSDNSLEKIDNIYDLNNADALVNVQSILDAGSYFICRFKLTVPAGRYIATLGRHNVDSAGDYRNTSTYIYGIANSRVRSTTSIAPGRLLSSLKPNSIGSFSKEMELDCVNADIDVWGNNADTFYVYAPYRQVGGNGKYRFIEGYFKESSDNPLPVELFPYNMDHSATDDCGIFTDKNGFYWAYTKVANANSVNIEFRAKVNCGFPKVFVIPTSQGGSGWKVNNVSYLASHTGTGNVGDCNRILYNGKITDLTGLIGYANIAVSIKDGATALTRTDGTFTLVIHNGQSTLRASNVYVNAGGNFLITLANCGQLPINNFSESLIPCNDCTIRVYPIPLNIQVVVENNTQQSLKEGGKYNIGIAGADLAGRLTYVNVFENLEVSTFLERNNINSTYFQMQINAALDLLTENSDIKWLSPYVSKNVIAKRYVQWVGDSLIYLDNSGNVVSDASTASFIKIVVQSLYDANVTNNFSLLSSYQFVKEDRLRVYDDGEGQLFNTAAFGDPIDVQVLGTNYNQAAINAGLLLPQTNTVLDNNNTASSNEIGLIVRYDPRLDKLSEKTGFWIEIYTPTQESDVIPFFEIAGFYPVIRGELAIFTGYDNAGQPQYNFPQTIDLDFWDTYYLQRSISGKYFSHPFESPNITDHWGANVTSGGRLNVENKDAKQIWLGGDVARSDSFMKNGVTNGLAMFRDENRKNYGIYPYGEIITAHTKRNVIVFNCVNDWFLAEYNMPYTRVKDGNLVVTNLDENLSLPSPKTGSIYGLEKKDIGAFAVDQDFFFWYDRKNTALIKCNYKDAIDVSQQQGDERGGLQSYLNAKTYFVNKWDAGKVSKDTFDAIMGLDAERGNLYFTLRPRRGNRNNPASYVNQRRNLDVKHQETFVYSIQYKGWVPCVNYTPESYARLRGNDANVEFISFAAGKPYYHNNTPNTSFLNFYGVLCEPVIMGVFNKEGGIKILESISYDCHGSTLFVDYMYDEQTNAFSYIPLNFWKEKEHINYSEVLRNMTTYPPINPDELFRSMLVDGKRIFGAQMVCRFVQKYEDLGKYFQLSGIDYLFALSFTNKP
jgi:hypothetical protein